jgi:hypothetical protein
MTLEELSAAVAVCKELGWDTANDDELARFALGSAQQQKIIKQGLSKGVWVEYEYYPEFREIDYLEGMDEYRAILAAIRVGVAPRRVIQLLRRSRYDDFRLLADFVAANGDRYAKSFIKQAARFSGMDRPYFNNEYNIVSFYLLTQHLDSFEVVAEPNYLQAWAGCALDALHNLRYRRDPRDDRLPEWQEIEPTFVDHLKVALDMGIPMWGDLGSLSLKAVERGFIDRESVLVAALASLDAVTRPGQRQRMIKLLVKDLEITDEEVKKHWGMLSTIVATAEPSLITAFGLRMISLADTEQLPDLALSALYVATLKGQKDLLKQLASRDDGSLTAAEILSGRVGELAVHKDKTLSRLAQKLLDSWGVATIIEPADEQQLLEWNKPLKLWQIPRFERGRATVDALRERMHSGFVTGEVRTLEEEAFLAQLVELAYKDLPAAHGYLAELDRFRHWWLPWRIEDNQPQPDTPQLSKERYFFIDLRWHLSYRIGAVPCLLSEPSFMDFTITFDDLLTRLDQYEKTGALVLEPDLQLVLTRLKTTDLDTETACQQLMQRKAKVDYGLVTILQRSAGEIIADYLRDPYQKPGLEKSMSRDPYTQKVVIQPSEFPAPSSFSDISPRLKMANDRSALEVSMAPLWGDIGWQRLRHHARARRDREGFLALQAARSATPLTPGVAMNLIGLCRKSRRGADEAAFEAVHLAWQRGILLPGVPDPYLLDWQEEVTNLLGIAEVLVELAQDEMLALSWQLLDDFLSLAATGTRGPAGANELTEAMEQLAPSVAAALRQHVAPVSAAKVPGLRFFAEKKGNSKVVLAARNAIKVLEAAG